MTSQPITIRLPAELYEGLRLAAFTARQSQNSIIVRAVAEHLAMCLETNDAGTLTCTSPRGHGCLHHDSVNDEGWESSGPDA